MSFLDFKHAKVTYIYNLQFNILGASEVKAGFLSAF